MFDKSFIWSIEMMLGTLSEILTPLFSSIFGALFSFIVLLFKTFKFVEEGQEGFVLRFGKIKRDRNNNPIIYKPGFRILIPFVDSLKKVHIRISTFDSGDIIFTCSDGNTFKARFSLIYRIKDLYKAIIDINDLVEFITVVVKPSAINILRSKKMDDIISRMIDIQTEIEKNISDTLGKHGVYVESFRFATLEPIGRSAELLGMKNSMTIKLKAASDAFSEILPDSQINQSLLAILLGCRAVVDVSHAGEIREFDLKDRNDVGAGANKKTLFSLSLKDEQRDVVG